MRKLPMLIMSAVVVVAGCASTRSPSVGITPRNTVEVLRGEEKVTTRVEKPGEVSAASQPIRVAQADTGTGKKMGNGWVITVYPKNQEAMVGRLIQPTASPVHMQGHEKFVLKQTKVRLEGESIFKARKSGKYVFLIRAIIDKSASYPIKEIYFELFMNDEKIADINSEKKYNSGDWACNEKSCESVRTKQLTLNQGEYNLSFVFAHRPNQYWSPDAYSVAIRLIEPGASEPRHLSSNDIVHYRN